MSNGQAQVQTETSEAPLTTEERRSRFEQRLQEAIGADDAKDKEVVMGITQTLAAQAMQHANLISSDAIQTIGDIIAEIDKKLSKQINLVLHHEKFQKLESAWRGLHYLVRNTEQDDDLEVNVFNISQDELTSTLTAARFLDAGWDRSPIFKKIYDAEYSMHGGKPFGCIVGDYYFDHRSAHVKTLGQMAKIAAGSHAPFIAGTSPSILGLKKSWTEFHGKHDPAEMFSLPEYAAWKALRETPDAKYLGLALPRFLGRELWGAKGMPAKGFTFEEDIQANDHEQFLWVNAAYAMAANITRSFKYYGWCSQITGVEAGGLVEGLPTPMFSTGAGGQDMKCPTEIAVEDRRLHRMENAGFMPLSHRKNTNKAAFFGAQSVYLPKEFDNPDATSSERLSARLPYLFAACRFAHYLKTMVRDKLQTFKEQEDMQMWLHNWINQNYVLGNPRSASDDEKAKRPLAFAQVVVEAIEGDPGAYKAHFHIRPHFKLEKLNALISLVSRLPAPSQK